MRRRLSFIFTLVTALVLGLSISPVFASHKPAHFIPEVSGLYDDPDHPGIKVRVYVHGEKPQTTTEPLLICSLDDPNSSAIVDPGGWHLPSNITYNLNPSSVPSSVGSGNLTIIADNGFDDWSAAVGNKVVFARGSDTTIARSSYDGKNIVAWGRTSGTALGVTYIRYYASSGLVVDVDTIMNKRVPWSWANSSTCADTASYDAENILTHELGHWIGLDDEYDSAYENNTMFGYGSKGEVKKVTLTTGDMQGAAALY